MKSVILTIRHPFLPLSTVVKKADNYFIEAYVDTRFVDELQADNEPSAKQQAFILHTKWINILEPVFDAGYQHAIDNTV